MNNQHSIRFGLMAGFGTVIILFLFYWIDRKLMLAPSVIWTTTILYIIGMYMAAIEVRKENEGYLAFRPALKAAFLVWVVANIIYYLYNYFLFNFIDPEMLEVQKQFMRDNMGDLEGFVSEENLELFEENLDQLNYKLQTVVMSYFSTLIGGFLLAALIGRMVRRNKPFEESSGSGQ